MGVARQYHTQQVHYLRKGFTFANDGQTLEVGTLPAGAIILKAVSGIYVTTAFNAGTTNVADIGTDGDADFHATDLALGVVGFVALDESVTQLVTADTDINVAVDLTGTAATTGAAEVVIAYIPDNDG